MCILGRQERYVCVYDRAIYRYDYLLLLTRHLLQYKDLYSSQGPVVKEGERLWMYLLFLMRHVALQAMMRPNAQLLLHVEINTFLLPTHTYIMISSPHPYLVL